MGFTGNYIVDPPNKSSLPFEHYEVELNNMAWSAPQYTKGEVDKAGAALLLPQVSQSDFKVVDNWRSAHNIPLLFFRGNLRKEANFIGDNYIVAQRIKRLTSITEKLRRFRTTRLSQIQDIGGCRGVLFDVSRVNELAEKYRNGLLRTQLVSEKNYIVSPKPDGYRAIHFVFRYADRYEAFRGLKIEMQLRSQKQHEWATAVETVGFFTHQALKSNKGTFEWRRFFSNMSSAIARMEGTNSVPNTDSDWYKLKLNLRDYAGDLDVEKQLIAYQHALNDLPNYDTRGFSYFLLLLDPTIPNLKLWVYKKDELQKATENYLDLERDIRGTQQNAVLVSSGRATDLRRAYPNYFLDTTAFVDLVNEAMH